MAILCYDDPALPLCPVLDYLSTLDPNRPKGRRLIAKITLKVREVHNHFGNPSLGYVSNLHELSFFELKHRKDARTLIRITFFYHGQDVVLLDAFEKPENYTKTVEKRRVAKDLARSVNYKRDFIENPKKSKPYEQTS